MRFVGLDPSTRTGFVAIDGNGTVLKAKELTGAGSQDPKRMTTLIDEIMAHIQKDDVIAIEGFAFGAQGQGVAFQYGLGHGIRNYLYRRGMMCYDIPPALVKKFATGKGNTKKDEMVLPIYKRWGFEHSSDNVRDAFVLAQIARWLHVAENDHLWHLYQEDMPKYQIDVINSLINPEPKKKKKVIR